MQTTINMNKILLIITFLLCTRMSLAQLYFGADGTTIAPGESLSYEGLILTPSAALTLSSTTLSKTEDFTINPVPGGGNYIKRYFSFSSTTPSFSGSVRFSYAGADLNSIPETDLRLNIRTNGTSWLARADAPNTVSDYVESSSILATPLNTLTLASANGALPLTWISFTAIKNGARSFLEWSTFNEKNTQDFVIQHSTSGFNWKNIGVVRAAGNSTRQHDYSFSHEDPTAGHNYYRLLQRDLDANFSYSKVVPVFIEKKDLRIKVLSNPVTNGELKILVPIVTYVKIFDAFGRQIINQQLNEGVHVINVSTMSGGIYYLNAGTETISIIIK